MLQWAGDAEIPQGAHEVRLELPTDLDLTLEGVDGLSADPARFRAPALIHVDRRPCYYAQLNVRVEPSSAVAQSDGWLAIRIEEESGGDEIARRVVARIRAGASIASQVRASDMVLRVGGPDGTIRWSGRGIADGAADFAGLEPHVPRAMEIVARLDGTALSAEDPRSGLPPPTRFRVLDPAARPLTIRCVSAPLPGGDKARTLLPGEICEVTFHGEVWISGVRGDEVAGPVRATPGRETLTEISLVQGGWVLVDADIVPPEGLGSFSVARRDGGMVLVNGALLQRIELLRRRCLIGPMPPGDYDLVVRLGDEVMREIRATIVAGEKRTLDIPRLTPR